MSILYDHIAELIDFYGMQCCISKFKPLSEDGKIEGRIFVENMTTSDLYLINRRLQDFADINDINANVKFEMFK